MIEVNLNSTGKRVLIAVNSIKQVFEGKEGTTIVFDDGKNIITEEKYEIVRSMISELAVGK